MQIWEYFLLINILTLALMWHDKSQSRKGGWRVPEGFLLILTAAGGTVGTLIGRSLLRHKTKKGSFVGRLYVIILAQIVLVGAWVFGFLPA